MSVTPTSPSTRPHEHRTLGVTSLVVFVLGAAAPLTILAGFAPLGMIAGGEGLVAGFFIPACVYLMFVVGFSAMSRHFNGRGAFYAYISRGLSRRIGAGAGVVSYVGYLGGQIGFTAAASVFASSTVERLFGISIPWLVYAIGFTVIVGALCYRSVHIGARVLTVLLAGEIGILVIFCIAVLAQGGYSGLSLSALSPAVVFSAAVPSVFVLTFTSFIGFEQTAIYSEEARDPRRTVSRATYIAIAILGLGYTFCAWVILQAVGPERMAELLAGDPSELVFALNDEYVGTAMTAVMHLLIVTSFFAGVLALQNACARYLLALADAELAPRALRRIGARTGTPSTGNVVQATVVAVAILVFAVVGANPYTEIVVWTNIPTVIAVLSMQVLTSIAIVRYFRADHRGESLWSRLITPAAASVLLVGALILLINNMSALSGLGPLGNALLFVPLILGAGYGVARFGWLQRHRPDLPEHNSPTTHVDTHVKDDR